MCPRIAYAAAVLIAAIGCKPVADNQSAQLNRELAELRSTVTSQASLISGLQSQISWMQAQIDSLQSKTITVDVSTPSFQCIDTNTVKFLIYCENVRPYADGQKLTFWIGNPYTVTFGGFKLKAKWGVRAPQYEPTAQQPTAFTTWQLAYSQWQKSLHEKEIDSAILLKPGIWNTVEVVLSPATAEELGYIELSMLTDKVALVRDKP